MDRSAVKAIVEREIEGLQLRLGIPHWRIVVDYDLRRSNEGYTTQGECGWRVDYNKASISLDPDAFDDERETLEVLRHELFHLLLSPFTVFLNTIKPLLRNDRSRSDMAENVWTYASEQAVINLERMYRGLTAPPPEDRPENPGDAAKCPTPASPPASVPRRSPAPPP